MKDTSCPKCKRASKMGVDIPKKGFCSYVNCDWVDYEKWPNEDFEFCEIQPEGGWYRE